MNNISANDFFRRWGVVAFNDNTGLGRQARDLKRVLGLGKHLVVPSERLETGRLDSDSDVLLDPETAAEDINEILSGLDGIICLERVAWHPHLVAAVKSRELRLVCVPNWEWFRPSDAVWREVDYFLCPTRKTVSVLQELGFRNCRYVTWALDSTQLPKRKISGPARLFVHNGGLVDHDDRKSTRLSIEAFKKVKVADARLLVRIQKETELPEFDDRVEVEIGNISLEELYGRGDVAVQPSKMEGLGFMVLEPVCCGIPVITTDAAPMNEWVRQKELRVAPEFIARKSFAYRAARVRHAYLRVPKRRALTRKMEWCCRHNMAPISDENGAWGWENFRPDKLQAEWFEALRQL